MLVRHRPIRRLETCQDLEAFLFNGQQNLRDMQGQKHAPRDRPTQASLGSPHWVSLTWELPECDPLVAFDRLPVERDRSFYLENPRQQQAIAAWGTTCAHTASGSRRFERVREFVRDCTDNATVLLAIAPDRRPTPSGLRFFCSFSFFDRPREPQFPAATVFLPHWTVSRTPDRTTATCHLALHPDSNPAALARDTWQDLEALRSLPRQFVPRPLRAPVRCYWRDIEQFQTRVRRALHDIDGRSLQKVVLSHAIDLYSRRPFDRVAGLSQLRRRYPDCYSFAVGNGRGQHFIGASPERLLAVRDRQLVADALAGSAPRGSTPSADAQFADRLLSSPKERHEHRVVLHFIQDRLRRLGLTLHPIPPVRLLQLSNIQHLWTPVRADVPAEVHPLHVLQHLHPTPAVAGVPRHLACAAIRQWEPFDRQLYAAPLGWIDGRGNAEFVVGIRSATLDGDRARLYAGAGIVAGSDPEKELAEIQLKLQALLKSLVGPDAADRGREIEDDRHD